MKTTLTYLTVFVSIFLISSCSSMSIKEDNCPISDLTPDKLYVSFTNLNDHATSSTEECSKVTVLVFDSYTGNRLLYKVLDNVNGSSEVFSLPEIGPYNYYIFGNTEYAGVSFESALKNVHHIDGIKELRKIKIDADYYNHKNSINDSKTLMYAFYKNLEAPIRVGQTKESPWKFNPQLSLGLSKVVVNLSQDKIGDITNQIRKVRLSRVLTEAIAPTYFTKQSANDITSSIQYDSSSIGLDTSKKEMGSITFYIPELLLEKGAQPVSTVEVLVANDVYKLDIKSNYNIWKSFVSHVGIDYSYYSAKEQDYNFNSTFRNMVYSYTYHFRKNASGKVEVEVDIETKPWDGDESLDNQSKVLPIIIHTDGGDFEDVDIPGEMVPKD